MRSALVCVLMLAATAAIAGNLPADFCTIDKSESQQANRKEFITRAINEGYFLDFKNNGDISVMVGAPFMALSFPDKNNFLRLLFEFVAKSETCGTKIVVLDGMTNKEIGEYAAYHGIGGGDAGLVLY